MSLITHAYAATRRVAPEVLSQAAMHPITSSVVPVMPVAPAYARQRHLVLIETSATAGSGGRGHGALARTAGEYLLAWFAPGQPLHGELPRVRIVQQSATVATVQPAWLGQRCGTVEDELAELAGAARPRAAAEDSDADPVLPLTRSTFIHLLIESRSAADLAALPDRLARTRHAFQVLSDRRLICWLLDRTGMPADPAAEDEMVLIVPHRLAEATLTEAQHAEVAAALLRDVIATDFGGDGGPLLRHLQQLAGAGPCCIGAATVNAAPRARQFYLECSLAAYLIEQALLTPSSEVQPSALGPDRATLDTALAEAQSSMAASLSAAEPALKAPIDPVKIAGPPPSSRRSALSWRRSQGTQPSGQRGLRHADRPQALRAGLNRLLAPGFGIIAYLRERTEAAHVSDDALGISAVVRRVQAAVQEQPGALPVEVSALQTEVARRGAAARQTRIEQAQTAEPPPEPTLLIPDDAIAATGRDHGREVPPPLTWCIWSLATGMVFGTLVRAAVASWWAALLPAAALMLAWQGRHAALRRARAAEWQTLTRLVQRVESFWVLYRTWLIATWLPSVQRVRLAGLAETLQARLHEWQNLVSRLHVDAAEALARAELNWEIPLEPVTVWQEEVRQLRMQLPAASELHPRLIAQLPRPATSCQPVEIEEAARALVPALAETLPAGDARFYALPNPRRTLARLARIAAPDRAHPLQVVIGAPHLPIVTAARAAAHEEGHGEEILVLPTTQTDWCSVWRIAPPLLPR